MKDDIERVEYASMLYDFYGSLLNEAQNEVMALYHEDNLSLSEIAEELGQTRQAVHYTLRKAEKALEAYEEKLGLVASYKANRELAAKAFKMIDSAGIVEPYADKLKKIIEQITE
ncbi:MAG: YlxM family DNA-binding protein [Mogibacterium sp.]|nr:YlxM family DNA-binding protein [Mogibacterium sp.]